jgi:hypothetical protein
MVKRKEENIKPGYSSKKINSREILAPLSNYQ